MKIYISILILIILTLCKPEGINNIVSISERNILLNNSAYTIKGICYHPVPKGSDKRNFSNLSQDLDLMLEAGINTIRVYEPITEFSVLDQIHAAGLKVIIGFGYNQGGLNDILSGTFIDYVNTYKNHEAILLWELGNEYNYHPKWFGDDIKNWYEALNNAAKLIHEQDLSHPVTTAHGELPDSLALAICTNIDVWGMNVYRWDNPEEIFSQWAAVSNKPMYLSEAGADSYMTIAKNGYAKGSNELAQADATKNILDAIFRNREICSGVTLFAFVDELWKVGNNDRLDSGGWAPNSSGVPYDGAPNEEYWGIVDIDRNKKQAFNVVREKYTNYKRESIETSKKEISAIEEGSEYLVISRDNYLDKLYGFWLGQCIANWTGLVTEMDKIGNIGPIKTGDFYTREDWGQADQPSIWGEGVPSDLSPTIDFVFKDTNEVWGADDDTDIEYIYQNLLYTHENSILSPEQIRDGWLKYIKDKEENFLWVSNQRAFDLMKEGILPPETGNPANNQYFEMIDAQLTTEIFGLFAPGRPDIALKMAHLPIQTTAREEAESISEFYVFMYSLASSVDTGISIDKQIIWMANQARTVLPDSTYPAYMFDYTKKLYESGIPWEQTRDSIYFRYQVNQEDGYDITSKNLYGNGCFAAGINFASSLVSLFYGKGDIIETIKIGTLSGWDSDNPTATWGGLLGFMIGKGEIEKAFGRKFSNQFNIHRTRQNFPNNGIDSFENMAKKGIMITDKVVKGQMGGTIDFEKNIWNIPMNKLK